MYNLNLQELKKSKEEHAESEKKQAATRNILQTAKTKLTSQKQEIDKAHVEIAELKKKLASQEQNSGENSCSVSCTYIMNSSYVVLGFTIDDTSQIHMYDSAFAIK